MSLCSRQFNFHRRFVAGSASNVFGRKIFMGCLDIGQCRDFGSRQVKKQKQQSSGGGGNEPSKKKMDEDAMFKMVIACLDAKPRKEPPERRTEEEMERRSKIVKAYTLGRIIQHNDLNHELACQGKLRDHAIEAIPEGFLKDEALIVHATKQLPPLWRPHAHYTPPIPGFDIDELYEDDEKEN